MIENMFRYMEKGYSPFAAALRGAKQIGFTVVSISVSLIAAFIPLLFMGGVIGRLFREFSVTLCFAIAVSTVMSLSVTPMICAYFVKEGPSPDRTWLDRRVEGVLSRMVGFYDRTLGFVLVHRTLTLLVFVATIALTVGLYIKIPKGYFPQDDTGLIVGGTQRLDRYFLQGDAGPAAAGDGRSCWPIRRWPASARRSAVAAARGSVNRGRLFISLKPLEERDNCATQARGRRACATGCNRIPGIRTFLVPAQDLRVGATAERLVTISSPCGVRISPRCRPGCRRWSDRVKTLPDLTDVNTDREQGGLQADIKIDREARGAARRPHPGHRQRAQQRFLAAADLDHLHAAQPVPRHSRGRQEVPTRPDRPRPYLYVPGNGNAQVALSSVARVEKGIAPLVVNHQGLYPSAAISLHIKPGVPIAASDRGHRRRRLPNCTCPIPIRADFAGDVKAFQQAQRAAVAARSAR